jgi:predicted AAA+ superfamily ATPase
VNNISVPKIPLSAYADYSKFKIYMHDVGLLGAQLQISSDLIVDPGRIFSEFNGAFIENFIAQELRYQGWEQLYYWTSRSDAEVDFIITTADRVVPVEIKSGMSRNLKSLRSYADKYMPGTIVRMSPRNFIMSDDFVNLPLYASSTLHGI